MDGITLGAENFSPSWDRLGVFTGPMNKNGAIGPQGLDKQSKWTRFTRMDFGPMDLLKEGAKSILGKRGSQGMQQDVFDKGDELAEKRVKSGDGSQLFETAGVSKHPCQAQ